MKKYLFFLLFPLLIFSQDTITKPTLSVISLDKVKVVYRGVDNPITVAVPNVKFFTVSGKGVHFNNDGTYSIRPESGLETKVYIEIILQDDSVVVEEHTFQIKVIPNPTTIINKQFSTQGYLEFSLNELKNAEIGVKIIDFLSPYYPIVTEFTIKIPRREPYLNEGNILSEEAYILIEKARKNDLIIITNVKWFFSGTNQLSKPSSSIAIKVVEKYNPKK